MPQHKCAHCSAGISLAATYIKCKCGKAFCAAHRHNHNCSFDYRQHQREHLQQSLGRGSIIADFPTYYKHYLNHHQARSTKLAHALGFTGTVCGLVSLSFFRASLAMWLVGGSVVVVRGWRWWSRDDKEAAGCDHCLWSVSGLRALVFAVRCEWEGWKEVAAFFLSGGKTNCMTRELYTGERTLGGMARVVWARLGAKSD